MNCQCDEQRLEFIQKLRPLQFPMRAIIIINKQSGEYCIRGPLCQCAYAALLICSIRVVVVRNVQVYMCGRSSIRYTLTRITIKLPKCLIHTFDVGGASVVYVVANNNNRSMSVCVCEYVCEKTTAD